MTEILLTENGSSSGAAIALAAAASTPGVERLLLWEVPLGPDGNLADARQTTVKGADHGWAATDMADVIASCLQTEE